MERYEVNYKQLVMNVNLQSLSSFRVRAPRQVYVGTNQYPQFFNFNLVSAGRVIKLLKGPNAIVRGFYYQFMKICFEIEVEDKNYLEIFKQKIFQPKLRQFSSSPTSGQLYSHAQYKKFIAEFIQILINQSIPNFELTINQYPIVDQALNHIFLTLINQSEQDHSNNLKKVQLLSSMFDIDFVSYPKCYKFEQSDVFLYEEGEEEIYMAFLNEMGEVSETETSELQNIESVSPNSRNGEEECSQERQKYDLTIQEDNHKLKIQENNGKNSNVIGSGSQDKSKYDSLINMVQDLSKYSKEKQSQRQVSPTQIQNHIKPNQKYKTDIENQKKNKNKQHELQIKTNNNDDFDKNISEVQSFNLHHSIYNSLASGEDQYVSKKTVHQSHHSTLTHQIYKTQVTNTNKFYQTNPIQLKQPPLHRQANISHRNLHNYQSNYRNIQQDLIYRPKKLNTITELSSLKQYSQSNKIYDDKGKYMNKNKYGQLNEHDSDSKGTFYKQFTSTKILQFVKEPHRTKIKLIKDRFVGVRSRKIRND